MIRYYVNKNSISQDQVVITDPDDVRHLFKILRVKSLDKIDVTDGEGGYYQTHVAVSTKEKIVLKIVKKNKSIKRGDLGVRVTLAAALPKLSRFEDIVDKCTQLGAEEIIPLITSRTLVDVEAYNKKAYRFQRIIATAAKQSGVLFVPKLSEPVEFRDLMDMAGSFDLALVPHLSDNRSELKDAVSGMPKKTGAKILVLIGPEGDFTHEEIEAAISHGFKGASLGASVLRVDTAAIAVMSYLRINFGL